LRASHQARSLGRRREVTKPTQNAAKRSVDEICTRAVTQRRFAALFK
jgi:hypothetical protein